MTKHRVRAAPDVLVPLEGAPGRHINSTEPQWVCLTPYYRRRIDDGDLVLDPLGPDYPEEPAPVETLEPAAPVADKRKK